MVFVEKIKKIDIHAHAVAFPEYFPPYLKKENGQSIRFLSCEELFEFYDKLNIEKGVLLPIVAPEGQCAPMSSEACKYLSDKYPDRLLWFFNLDPQAGRNCEDTNLSHFINHYKNLGALGLGELTSQLPADDPRVDNLFAHCAACNVPVTIHISAGYGNIDDNGYGIIDDMGLPRIEKMLKKHKNLKIIGHSQLFWAEISGDLNAEERKGYPKGKVTEGTLTRLLRTYDNLYCDLSAGSGANAMMRDPEFAAKFMEEFSDRILYGCDICHVYNTFPYDFDRFLDGLCESGAISEETYRKIVRENAIRLLKLDEK